MEIYEDLRDSLYFRLFGNLSGINNNIFSILALRKARRKTSVAKKSGFEQGRCFIPQGCLDDEIKQFQSWFEKRIEDSSREHHYKDEIVRRTVDSHTVEDTPPLQDVLNDDIRDAITDYYGSRFDVVGWHAYRHYHRPEAWKHEGDVPSIKRWHLDRWPPTSIKLFVLLNDVGPDDGPTEFIPTSESEGIDPAFKQAKAVPPEELKDYEIRTFTGKAGTAALFNPQLTVHRAGDPEKDRTRDMLVLKIVPSKTSLTEDWYERDYTKYPRRPVFRDGLNQYLHV